MHVRDLHEKFPTVTRCRNPWLRERYVERKETVG